MLSQKYIRGWPFIIPGMFILSLVIGVPLVYSFRCSLYEILLYHPDREPFVGLRNYIELGQSWVFWKSVRVTILFASSVTVFSVLIGLLVAVLLSRKDIRGRTIFMTFFLLPFVMTPVVTGILWRLFIWQSEFGLVNYMIGFFGSEGVNWLINKNSALWAVIMTDIWRLAPLALLVFYAALTTLPTELFDAAKIDGAGWISVLWKVTIPLIKNHIIFISLVIITSAFREFGLVKGLTGGGPCRSTTVLSILAYNWGLGGADMGCANAVAFSMFIMIAVICWVYIKIFVRGS